MADLAVRTDPGSGATYDPRFAGTSLLLKTALQGKTFQKARREVAREEAPAPPPPSPPEPTVATRTAALKDGSTKLDVEIDRLSVELQASLQTGASAASTASISITGTQIHASITLTGHGTPPPQPSKDPLVLDLAGTGPETTGQAGARAFDLAGDGHQAPTSFAAGGTAFLALDRNGNGRIDSGLELFGDQHGAADGYAELAKFDANQDGRIDAGDPVYGQLQLLYGNGSTTSLASSGIQSLSLESRAGSGTTSGGDAILGQSTASLSDGSRISTYTLGLNRFDTLA